MMRDGATESLLENIERGLPLSLPPLFEGGTSATMEPPPGSFVLIAKPSDGKASRLSVIICSSARS